ncbi:MAG: DUF1080 domain-containing protein [Clostridiales bacterium]|nr:DUF1080 domain-containing protein [Clostridiales bacterium]MCF8022664.1 DUF1080 domain-containing protein [Clostridiales bacterium]
MRAKKLIAIFAVFVLLINFVPLQVAQAQFISDPTDLGSLSMGDPVDVDGTRRNFYGYWDITVNDANGSERGSAKDMAIAHDFRPSTNETGNILNYIADSKINDWVDLMKGNQSYVDDKKDREMKILSANSRSSDRIHIRDLAELCGAWVPDYDANAKTVEIQTTPLPSARISYDGNTKEGDTETFRIYASGYAAGQNGINSWKFKIDGVKVDYGGGTSRLSDSVTNTFNNAGTYTATLEVEDNVGRKSSDSITVTVGSGTQPPQPPPEPPSSGPDASFDMPFSTTAGDDVDIQNNSSVSDGHIIEDVDWDVEGSYSGTLGTEGGTITFNQKGSYDVTLTVEDDQGKTDSTTQTIIVEEQPPPPPPPNEEPTAEFDMPGHCKQGDTVDVENLSNDDGTIVDVNWQIDPSTGVTDNLDDNGGTLTFSETGAYTVTLTVEDDDGATDSEVDSIEVSNEPPEAEIDMPGEIVQGQDLTIECDSFDPDGSIASRSWSVAPEGMKGTLDGEQSTVYFDKDQDYTVELTVEDQYGLTDTATKNITVKPAIPEAYYEWNGSPKQNRKMVFDASGSRSSERYPIIWDQAQWEYVTPVGATQDDIKVVNTGDLSKRKVLFKKPGDYTVKLKVTNEAGHTSEWYKKTVSVMQDKPPKADFRVTNSILRDPDNDNKAKTELVGNSYSPDGDTISHRVWTYKYDSNNDGSFSDETEQVLDDGNNSTPVLYTKDVGKYKFELSIKESFGQETISQFVTEGDRLSDNTSDKPLADKKVEVLNRQPVVNFDSFDKKKADVVFTVNSSPPSPEINWIENAGMNRGEFKEVIEAENDEVTKMEDSWGINSSGAILWLMGDGGCKVTFNQPSTAVYVDLSGGDDNDGIARIYVDGTYYGQYDTYNTNDLFCEIKNLPEKKHTVKIMHGDSKHISVDYFATKNNQRIGEELLSNLNENINQHFEPKLSANNIDTKITSLETSSFSTNDANADFIFRDWINYPNDTGQWELTTKDGENAIGTTENVAWTGFWQQDNATDMTIEYDAGVFHGDDDTVGFTFRMQHDEENDTYTGYAFAIDKRTSNGGCYHPGLYKLVNVPYDGGDWWPACDDKKTFSNGGYSEKLIPTNNPDIKYESYGWQHVKIKAVDDNIKVWVDGTLQIDYTDSDPISWGGYGPFAVSQAYAYFKDVKITTESQQSLDEVLKQPDWREDAQHFLVNISDTEYPGFKDPQKASKIYSCLLDDKIHYCVMGSDSNKGQTQEVVDNNKDRGKFVYNNDMPNNLSNLADYIVNQVNSEQGSKVKYILKGQEIEYKTYYKDKESDPEIQRRWRYSHHPDYYDKSLGVASYDDMFIPAPVTSFSKTGEFETVFQAKDNPKDDDRFSEYREWSYMPQDKLNLYVHRRPKAIYDCNANYDKETQNYQDYNIDFSDEDDYYAYWNPQFNAPNGETIKTIEFRTPEADDDEWRNNLFVKGYRNGSWHTIKDYESSYEWSSTPVSDTINVSGQGYTKVKFNFAMYDSADSAYGHPDNSYYMITTEKIINSGVQYNDYSYDPDHQSEPDKGIANKKWAWKEIGGYSYTTNNYRDDNIDFSDEDGWDAYWNPQFNAPSGETIETIEFRTPEATDDNWEVYENGDMSVQGYKNGSWQVIKSYESSYEYDSCSISDTLDVSGQEYTKVKFKFRMEDDADSAYGDHDNSYYRITTEKKITNMSVSDWNPGKLNNIEQGKIYLTSLRVKDDEGVWSYRETKVVDITNRNMKPVAQFKVKPNPVIQNNDVQYMDNSYDPDGDNIIEKQWRVKKKPDGAWNTYSSPPATYSDPGDYKIELKVRDQSSETIEKTHTKQNIDFSEEDGYYAYWMPQFNAPDGETIKTIDFRTPVADDDKWTDDLPVKGYKDGSWHTIKDYESLYEWDSNSFSDTLDVSGQGYTKVKFSFQMYDSADSAYGDPDSSYYNITTEKHVKSWSDPFYQTLHVKPGNAKPVADFTVSPDPAPVNSDLSYTDNSSDPDGDPIVDESWRWKKDGSSEWHYGKPFTPRDLVTKIKRADEIAQGELPDQGPLGNVISIQENKGSTLITFHSSPHVEGQLTKQNAEIITLSFEGSDVNVQSGFFTTNASANSGANDGGWDGIQIEGKAESITFTDDSALHVFVNNELYATGTDVTYHPTGSCVEQDIELGDYQIAKKVKDMPSLTNMNALWSSWHEEILKVVKENKKPVAQFSVTPDPAAADSAVTYTDNSYDPESEGITERVWRVKTSDGTLLGEYTTSKPPGIFADTGWGDNGAGEYSIGLKVKDTPPNPYAAAKWSDWTWHDLKVVIPLQGSGEITPDPAPSGYNVNITIDTEGYADKVTIKFPNNSYFNGDEVTLTSQDPLSNKFNTFNGNYKTDIETPNGTYNVTATIKRTSIAPQTITVPLTMAIQGDIYDQVKVRKKDTR